MLPVFGFGRYHIQMGKEDQRRRVCGPCYLRHHIASPRVALQYLGLDSLSGEDIGHILRRKGLVSWRIGSVQADELLEKMSGFDLDRFPI